MHAHGAHAFGDQVADGIIDHRAGDAGVEPEAIGEIGRDVELAAADVDVAMRRFAERDDAGVEAMDEGAEGTEIECALCGDVETVVHLRVRISAAKPKSNWKTAPADWRQNRLKMSVPRPVYAPHEILVLRLHLDRCAAVGHG